MINFQAIFFLGNEVDCPVPSSEQHLFVVHTCVSLKILMWRIIVYEMCIVYILWGAGWIKCKYIFITVISWYDSQLLMKNWVFFFCERKYMSGILLMSWYFFSLNAHFGHIIYNIAIEFRYRNQMFIKLSFTAEFKRERANDDDACPFHQFVRTTNLLWGLLSNSSCYCTFITSFSAKRGHNGLKSFSNVD